MIGRITILGGSSVYIPEFIVSIVSHNVNVKEVMLVGREGAKLPVVASFCQRLLDKNGFPAKVMSTTDLEEGVTGAKYVLNAIRVGGMKARLRDEKMPLKFGMVGDESLGAGGFANAVRTLPVVFDVAKRIEAVSPDATFINLTNPMGIIVEALCKYSGLKTIGTCDLPEVYVTKVAKVLRRPPSEVSVDYLGLNHLGWIQDVKVDGRSFMGVVLERIERSSDVDGFDTELIELFRMIPTRTVGIYFNRDEVLKEQKTCARFRAEILMEAEQEILAMYADEHLNELPNLTRRRKAIWYEETIVPLIEALESKKEQCVILCVRNDGAIRDLPDDCSVEVPVRVSRKGLKPRAVGSCPRFLKGLFIAVKESERLAVESVRHKSYECALQSLVVNPLVPSLKAAREYLDYLIREERLELH